MLVRPGRKHRPVGAGKTWPSIVGHGKYIAAGAASASLLASIARKAARFGTCRAAASLVPLSSADGEPNLRSFNSGMEIMYALSAIAFENKPRAAGAAIRYMTLSAPADSPAMVTLEGSPPNEPMLRLTHRSASI